MGVKQPDGKWNERSGKVISMNQIGLDGDGQTDPWIARDVRIGGHPSQPRPRRPARFVEREHQRLVSR